MTHGVLDGVYLLLKIVDQLLCILGLVLRVVDQGVQCVDEAFVSVCVVFPVTDWIGCAVEIPCQGRDFSVRQRLCIVSRPENGYWRC